MSPSAVNTSMPAPVSEAAKHRSGDPELAVPKDEATMVPHFTDKYEERAYLKHRLAIAFRIFAQNGLSESVAGHITLKDPVDPTSFWVNPFGMHFSLIRDEDLLRVDRDGNVVDGGKNRRLNHAAYAIHHEVHKARPEVICAAHSHSVYGRAMCATGRTLDMLTQDFCSFYEDLVLYPNFAGVVLAAEEGKSIAKCLGNKKAALLGNHGLLTVGQSVESAVLWFVLLENLCKIQLAADASANGRNQPLVTIGHEEAQSTKEAVGTERSGYFQGLPLFQVGEREFGESTYLGRGFEPL